MRARLALFKRIGETRRTGINFHNSSHREVYIRFGRSSIDMYIYAFCTVSARPQQSSDYHHYWSERSETGISLAAENQRGTPFTLTPAPARRANRRRFISVQWQWPPCGSSGGLLSFSSGGVCRGILSILVKARTAFDFAGLQSPMACALAKSSPGGALTSPDTLAT